MMKIILLLSGLASVLADEAPVYPQVRFQPIKNVLVLPSSEQLKELAENKTTTEQQDTQVKDLKPDERRIVTMEELRSVDGSLSGSYHVLLENGKLQRVEYTAAPRLPVREQVKQEPEIRSFYYTQVPADILQRYYAEFYNQQENAQYKRPSSVNQATASNSQGISQSSSHGTNQASNHNVQVFNQGKRAQSLTAGNYESAASHLNAQRTDAPFNNGASNLKSSIQNQNVAVNSEQRVRSREEVETFEPVQRTKGEREQGVFPNGLVATIYYTDVNPITGPIYTFEQTPLVRILREA